MIVLIWYITVDKHSSEHLIWFLKNLIQQPYEEGTIMTFMLLTKCVRHELNNLLKVTQLVKRSVWIPPFLAHIINHYVLLL